MRLILELRSSTSILLNFEYYSKVQGFIYSTLRNSSFYYLHDKTGYKFFTFSNIFKIKNNNKNNNLFYLLISSPYSKLIREIGYNLQNYIDLDINSPKDVSGKFFIPMILDFTSHTFKRLRNLNLSGFSFSNLDLSGINFSNCNLCITNFMRCNLSNSNLSHTYLFGTIFVDADLKNSNFQNALIFTDLSLANNLDTVDFRGSITNNKTLIKKLNTYGIPHKNQPKFVNSESELKNTLLKMSFSQKHIDRIISQNIPMSKWKFSFPIDGLHNVIKQKVSKTPPTSNEN